MPNHTTNKLIIKGTNEEIQNFIDYVKSDKQALDFDVIKPMSEEIRNTTSPSKIQTREEIDEQWRDYYMRVKSGKSHPEEDKVNRPFGIGITQEYSDYLTEKYGADNWYDWCVENWGTKWNCYDLSEWTVSEGRAEIMFYTAWSPPMPITTFLSNKFNNMEIELLYSDEGGGFVGKVIYEKYDIVSYEPSWDCDEGIKIREELGVYCPEDEEQEDGQVSVVE